MPQDHVPDPLATGWTLVARGPKRPSKYTKRTKSPPASSSLSASSPFTEPSHLPARPPSPDPALTLASLRTSYQHTARQWHAPDNRLAEAWKQIIAAVPPRSVNFNLDTVVLVALGSLSASGGGSLCGKGRKGGAIGGGRRADAMVQVVALEAWVEILRGKGHGLPAPAQSGTDEGDDTPTTPEASPSPYIIPTTLPLHGAKIVQDPLLNVLDAAFLRERGYVVLPSTPAACRVEHGDNGDGREHGGGGGRDGCGCGRRKEHAANHVTPSTLVFAPHAPGAVVREVLFEDEGDDGEGSEPIEPSEDSKNSKPKNPTAHTPSSITTETTGPGLYIGNLLPSDAGDVGIQRWRAQRVEKTPEAALSRTERRHCYGQEEALWATGVYFLDDREIGKEGGVDADTEEEQAREGGGEGQGSKEQAREEVEERSR